MKKLIYSALVGTLALALSAVAADNNKQPKKGKPARQAAAAPAAPAHGHGRGPAMRAPQARMNRAYTRPAVQQRRVIGSRGNAARPRENNVRTYNTARRYDTAVQRHQRGFNRTHIQPRTVETGNTAVASQVAPTRTISVSRIRSAPIVNNWSGSNFSGQQYSAFRSYQRHRHDRNWWTSHYNRIVFFGGGPYYWDSGYWYPAWGYDPGYNYAYDGPIYGYNDLTPDQVVVDVQQRLQNDGYYPGPIDGDIGPMTRRAIAAYQADHGLPITSAIDQPTLATLGLV